MDRPSWILTFSYPNSPGSEHVYLVEAMSCGSLISLKIKIHTNSKVITTTTTTTMTTQNKVHPVQRWRFYWTERTKERERESKRRSAHDNWTSMAENRWTEEPSASAGKLQIMGQPAGGDASLPSTTFSTVPLNLA